MSLGGDRYRNSLFDDPSSKPKSAIPSTRPHSKGQNIGVICTSISSSRDSSLIFCWRVGWELWRWFIRQGGEAQEKGGQGAGRERRQGEGREEGEKAERAGEGRHGEEGDREEKEVTERKEKRERREKEEREREDVGV